MPGGRRIKAKGTAFEYRVRNFFKNKDKKPDWPQEWSAQRNDLSGASKQFQEEVSKHDVRAWKNNIFLQIEAKSTFDREKLNIRKEWLDKIDFDNDEMLVIGFHYDQTMYAMLPLRKYWDLQGVPDEERKELEEDFKDVMSPPGKVQFKFKKDYFEGGNNFIFYWDVMSTYYVIFPLIEYVTLRENYTQLIVSDSHIENIKRMNTLEDLVSYGVNSVLSIREQIALLSKIERLTAEELGEEPSKVNPEFIANEQFWLKGTDKEPIVLHLNKEMREKVVKEYNKIKKDDEEVSMTKMVYDILKDCLEKK